MDKKEQVYDIIAGAEGPLGKQEIQEQAEARGTAISGPYLSLVLHELLEDSFLEKVGRGRYRAVTGIPREIFSAGRDPATDYLRGILRKDFPSESFCIWNSRDVLSRLIDVIIPEKTIIIECSRESVEAVWRCLIARSGPYVVYGPPDKELSRTASGTESITVRPFISDSPVNESDGVVFPRLEKVLVDLLSCTAFDYLTSDNVRLIWRNAFSDFIVNESALMRYAARRNREQQARDILDGLQIRPKRLSLFNDWLSQPHYDIPRWLLWDYDVNASYINWDNMKTLIAERVMKMGGDMEWYGLLQRYGGKDNVAHIVKQIKVLDPSLAVFGMQVLGIEKKGMLCLNRPVPEWRKEYEDLFRDNRFKNL